MANWISTRFKGVRYKESEIRNIEGKVFESGKKKPKSWKGDRCYTIRYHKYGKAIEETIGWYSEGVTDQFAANERGGIITNIKTGAIGKHQSLKEKQGIEKERRGREEAHKAAEALKNIPFHVLGDRYIDWAEGEKGASWKSDESRYRQHLKPFLGDLLLKDISPFTLEKFKKQLKAKKTPGKKLLSPKTIQLCLTLVRQMYNKAQGWELYSGPNPVTEASKAHKKFLKIPDNRRLRFLLRSEAGKLLDQLEEKNIQLHDITVLGIYAGLRANEIFSLLWRDIDLENGVINIKDPKGVMNRVAYITKPIRVVFKRRKAQGIDKNSLVFKNRNGEKINEISNAFDRTIAKMGLNKGVEDPRDKVVFHTTRHTFASWSAMAGTHLATLQKLMGHKKIEMTLRYSHLCPSHEREAAERMALDASVEIAELKEA